MRDAGPSRLFHAIVGLGLAAVGCGGEITGQADGSGAEDARVPSGDAEGAETAAESGEDATATADVEMTVDAGVADAELPIDAAMARDAARDVAREAWPPPPIK